MQLDLRGRACVVFGGGQVATRKIMGLLEGAATITVVSPQLTTEIERFVNEQRIVWRNEYYRAGQLIHLHTELKRIWLVFAATDQVELNRQIVDEARALGVFVSSATDPHHADFTLPAVVRRGALTLSVSTSGASPILTQHIRDQLALDYGEEFGPWLAFLSEFREYVLSTVVDERIRRAHFAQVLTYDGPSAIREGRWEQLKELIWREYIASVDGNGE